MVEENNARHASHLRDQEKPAEGMPRKANATESAVSIGQKQSTSPTSKTSLQPGNDPDSQGKTSDVKPSSSDLPESKMPSNLPSATAVLDMGSRVLGIGLSISALLSMHRDSLKPTQDMVNPLYRAPLLPDEASVGLNSAAPSSSLGTSSTPDIFNASYHLNGGESPTAADPLALRDSEFKTPATSGQGESEGSNDQGKTSDTEDTGQNDDTVKASLKRKQPGPEDESRIDTSPEPEPMYEIYRGGGGIPIKGRLDFHVEEPLRGEFPNDEDNPDRREVTLPEAHYKNIHRQPDFLFYAGHQETASQEIH